MWLHPHHINLPGRGSEKKKLSSSSSIHSHHCGSARWAPPEPAQHSDVPRSAADGSGHLGRFLARGPLPFCLAQRRARLRVGTIPQDAHKLRRRQKKQHSTHKRTNSGRRGQSGPVRDCSRNIARLARWPLCHAYPVESPRLMRGAARRRIRISRRYQGTTDYVSFWRSWQDLSKARNSTAQHDTQPQKHAAASHGMYLQWPSVASAFKRKNTSIGIMHSSSEQPWLALFRTSWPAG